MTVTDYDTSFVTVNDVTLRLAVTGTGPPLMFLFGSGRAGTIENAKPIVDRFAGRFTVACPEQRGLGQSEIPPGPWTMRDYADDAFAVADRLGWVKFRVIGISFGGMVALEMAATEPGRIDRMVLWGTSPGGAAHSYPLHTLAGLPQSQQTRIFAELMDTRLSGQWKSAPSREMQFVQAVLARGGNPWQVAAGEDESRNRGFKLQLEARRGHDVVDRLGQIEAQTFIGAGFYDGLAPAVNAELMQFRIRDSQLRVYEAGHFFYLEPKAFNDGLTFLTNGTVA